MKLVKLLACVTLAGCASSGGGGAPVPASGPRESTTTVETFSDMGSVDLRTVRSDPTAAFDVAAPPERVWSALSLVYTDLKLPVTEISTQARRLGSDGTRIRRQLGGTRLSRYLSCGERLGMPVAESDEVVIRLVTQVEPAGEGKSKLRTLFEATARGSTDINCATTGELEQRIVEMVRARATG